MNSKQEEFDAVVDHLYTQGRPAKNGNLCAYRSTDGLSCAVGCRIPDEAYDAAFEGRHVQGLLKRARDAAITLPPEIEQYYEMFDNLQDIHDEWCAYEGDSYSFGDLVGRLQQLAEKEKVVFNDPRVPV